jgi:serine/threonine protein kinase/Tfp pilus assembly protein PilF
MEPGRWARITDIYHATIARPREERASFIGQECHGDESLRKQVEAMVKSHERSGDFIESPAFAIAPELLIDEQMFDLIGQSIGHYQIESLLGVGGMGEVYLARDERLGRKAALKLLPHSLTTDEAQLSRFKNEARSASALNHPNILTVYEIGAEGNRQFIATEFIEGITLRASLAGGRINPHVALEIAVQVASALAAAHEAGVVHRDIKPENIMLRPDGYAKVLDFGIAKLTEQRPASDDHTVEIAAVLQTRPGFVLGTAHYMSPEQARGQKVDARSDIWSLGVVLYEMVAGSPPFRGETPSDCIASILTTEPPPLSGVLPEVSLKLESILQKALRKNSDERYQTIKEMLADFRNLKGELEAEGSETRARAESIVSKIKRHKQGVLVAVAAALLVAAAVAYSLFFVAPAPSPDEKSIAVLPFENLSSDKENAYFATAVQDEILTRLSKIAALKVISRTSTQQYGVRPGNLPEIARQLAVANILEGSVQKAGDQVRINTQLIRAATDEHLWAESYDRKLENILGVEAEVATAVAEALKMKLTGAEQKALEQRPTNNPEAYDAYLGGLAYSLRPGYSRAENDDAINFFREAVRLDPKFAVAWAWLAHESALGYFNQIGADFQALGEEAKRAADQAITLQPDLAESCLAQGYSYYYGQRDFDSAIAWFEKARSLSPKNSQVLEALALVNRRTGEWQRSLEYFRQAMELDPRNVTLLSDAGDTFRQMRRYAEALRTYNRLLDMIPDEPHALASKIGIYQNEGDLATAAAMLAPLHPAMTSDVFQAQIDQWTYERRYADAIAALKNAVEKPDPTATDDWNRITLEASLAWLQQVSGDISTARDTWEDVRSKLEQLRPTRTKIFGAEELALAYVALGDKNKAFAIVKEADAVVPASKDAMAALFLPRAMARIAVLAGEKELALQELERLAQMSGNPIGYGNLKFSPEWDSLRGDPRFEKIVASLAPKDAASPTK